MYIQSNSVLIPSKTLMIIFLYKICEYRSVAVCRGNRCEIYTCPSAERQFNLFTLKFVLRSFHDRTTCINWTSDSRFSFFICLVFEQSIFSLSLSLFRVVAVGSADSTLR